MDTHFHRKNSGITAAAHTSRTRLNLLLISSLLVYAVSIPAQPVTGETRETFDTTTDGLVPTGWNVDATNPAGPLALWKVKTDPRSPSPPKMLTIERILDKYHGVFNLCWSKQLEFEDGEVEVRVRANSGESDQGGGLLWRIKDANNYYVARYNPLENNFRLYYVKEGRRTQLASAENLAIPAGAWFHLRIAQHGQRIQGWFNTTLVWDVNNAQIPEKGGVGVWTKADAVSSFDDFIVRSTTKTSTRPAAP
jgi:hypothetical protein